MAVNINADTTTGLELTSDTSGNINIQNNGTTKVAVTAPGVAVTGALSATGDITTPGVTIGATTVTATSFSGDGSSLTGIAGGFSNMEVFTSPGTWTNPGSVQKVKVTVVGGGGSTNPYAAPGGSCGAVGGGGGGGTAIEVIPFPSGTNVAVTVGGAAGTSSFGAYCSASGGATTNTSIASPSAAANGGAGGSGSGGTINISGSNGGYAYGTNGAPNSGFATYGGNGGGSALAQGAQALFSFTPGNYNQSVAGSGYGAGASGGGAAFGTPTQPGQSGAPGVVIVEY